MKLPILRRPSRGELIDGGVLLLLCGLAVFSFRSSYGGTEFLIIGVGAALLGIALAFLAVSGKWPLPVAVAVAVVVYAVVGGAVALHDRTIAGFLPSPASTLAALRSVITGWKELITTAPPVGNTGDLMVLPFLGGFVAGFAGFMLARSFKSAAPALVAPAVLLGVGIATGTNTPVSLLLNGALFGGVAMGWLAWREHGRRPLLAGASLGRRQFVTGVGVLAVASVGGFALAGSLPFTTEQPRTIWRQTVTPPFDPNRYPSPLSAYRRYVKDAAVKDLVMFTVEGLPEGVPVRLATMDTYDGLVWKVSGGDVDHPSLDDSGSFERVGASLEPGFAGDMVAVTVTIGKYNDVWIPDVGEVRTLQFTGSSGGSSRDRELADAFRYNRSTDTAASRLQLREGDRYVMEVRLPVSADTFAGRVLIPTAPRLGTSFVVGDIAQNLQADVLTIKDTGTQIDTMTKLMLEGTYSDGDPNSGQQGSRAGHSSYRLREFVGRYPQFPLIGNAEQYAATFALFFRDLNHLPTRVVMGFRPKPNPTGGPVVEVHAKDVEAWVEVPVDDEENWVAIFPTPPRDQLALSAASEQQPEPDYRTQNPPPPPMIDPEFEQSATASGKAKSTKKTEPPKAAEAPDNSQSLLAGPAGTAAKFVGVPVALLLAAGGVIVILKRRRSRKRRSEGAPHIRIANGWREVTDFALDRGQPVPSTTTRREAAAFVGSSTSRLASRADEVVWGASEPSGADVEEYWAELSSTLHSMRSELGIVDRVKTAVSLRSLKLSQRVKRVRKRSK